MKTIIEILKNINKPKYKDSFKTSTLILHFLGFLAYSIYVALDIQSQINNLDLIGFVYCFVVMMFLTFATLFTFYEILKNIKHNIVKYHISLIYGCKNLNKTIKNKINIVKVSIIKKQIILILLGSFLIALNLFFNIGLQVHKNISNFGLIDYLLTSSILICLALIIVISFFKLLDLTLNIYYRYIILSNLDLSKYTFNSIDEFSFSSNSNNRFLAKSIIKNRK